MIVLNHPTDELTQLQSPTAGSNRERAYLMEEAIRRLAENRPACEILKDLPAPAADILRLRVESRDAEAGSLPLDEGLRQSVEPRRERVEGPIVSLKAEPAQLYEVFQGRVMTAPLIAGRAARVRFVLAQADLPARVTRCATIGPSPPHRHPSCNPKAKLFDLLLPQSFQVLDLTASAPSFLRSDSNEPYRCQRPRAVFSWQAG